MSIVCSAGYETSGAGYEFAIYYIARANITIEGKDYGTACGKVFEGSEGVLCCLWPSLYPGTIEFV